MWKAFFNRKSTPKVDERLEAFEETLKTLERRVKSVELDWELAYDKLHVLMGRISKRAEKMHKEAENEGRLYPSDTEDLAPESSLTRFSTLSPRQVNIQREIMRRRANGGAKQ